MFAAMTQAPRARLDMPLLAAILLGLYCHWALLPIFAMGIATDYAGRFDYLALAGTGTLAASFCHLLARLEMPDLGQIALCVVALPSVLIEAFLIGRFDSICVAPCIMAVAAALGRKPGQMLAWGGLALAIDPQALMIAPFMLAMLIARPAPIRVWLIAPATFLVILIPFWLSGWPADNWLISGDPHAESLTALTPHAPNVWMIIDALGIPDVPFTGLALVAVIGASIAYVVRFGATARMMTRPMVVRTALLAPLIIGGLAPAGHAHHFLIADILSIAVALTSTNRGDWRIAVLILGGSTLALLALLTETALLAAAGGVMMLAATLLVASPLLNRAANDNPLLPRRG